jgi:hypothetical protein
MLPFSHWDLNHFISPPPIRQRYNVNKNFFAKIIKKDIDIMLAIC